jgi:predicted RecA/RadA family phage recombinase
VATGYRHSGKKIPVASASGTITSGSLVFQEGFLGVAITDAASGKSLTIDTEGVWVVAVPASTVKGDKLWATLSAESTGLTLKRSGQTTGDSLVGIAVGDRDAAGKALVLLARQPFFVLP